MIWVVLDYSGQCFRFFLESGSSQSFCILFGLPREIQFPHYQSRSWSHSSMFVFIPSRMDSRMPGMEAR